MSIRAGIREEEPGVWHCDTCGTRGVDADHEPGGDVCRLLALDRYAKNRAG